jgi:internalin A
MKSSYIMPLIKEAQKSGRTELRLTYKKLTFLPPEISKLKFLTKLDLSKNELTSLPPEISELESLKKLDLSRNRFTSLPLEILELKYLTNFHISRNQLTTLPPEISKLKSLTRLFIRNNQLASLPTEISNLKNLIELDLSGNELTYLPPEISELESLEKLILCDNQLISLPPEISKLKNLIELDLSGNELTFLPPEISELKCLRKLNLCDNQLTSLPPEISELKDLTKLNLSGNQLVSIPSEISRLKNLIELDLSRNQLVSLPSEISELKDLNVLALYNNQLTALPPTISKLEFLTKLDLFNNQLTSLPMGILELDLEIELEDRWKSNIIYLGENPLENPPVEIVKKGREAVINYFKSLEGEKKPLNEVKVLLVGDGEAGKTSLMKRIFGEEVDGNESQTQGINIRKLTVNNGDREIKANFWDFGGQEIMHATHQFFLSKRSLYILVLDGRKDEKPEYWLKLIENFGRDSPVLVVINKIDQNSAFELNRKFLKEKYPSIKDFYRLSCKSNEGVKEFLKALKEELTKVKHLEIKWPMSWFNVKNRLEEICPSCPSANINGDYEHCNFIEYTQYETMCYEEGIKSESLQNTLVDFLHDLGVILHFRDIPLLNTYVLEPQWVTNAVYKIVTSKKIAESKGILKPDSMLPEILKKNTEADFYYPPYQYGFFVSLMKKFELSYDLDDKTVLLPASLEIQEPDFKFDYEETLRFVIDYDFIPPSVMPRFIVKMNRDINDDLRWRTGVVLENKGYHSTALIRADVEAKKISIYVNGDQRRDYFSVILQMFREINNSFEKLKAIEKIPLPDNPEVTVSYDHLIKLELKGIETYMPDGSDNEYDVSALLGTVINRSNERALLEEILRIAEMNRSSGNEILKILQKLQEAEEESDTEETLIEKANNIISFSPGIPIIGANLNVNEIVKLYLRWKKRKQK